ncbi:MAG TPA: Glu/Leu/Phe/Val dehydrogenase dimerization domain-containing protein, partial [Gaiellales bacterium]|nr:Glu/Leu/Phe/Val dehydrogenase dimerization domain-containing protein [Gaiellales bacterium]
ALGGGKAVVVGDPRRDKHPSMFRELGRLVESLGGRYLAAEDVGTSTQDAEIVATETRYVTGLPVEMGGSGDPSPMTAWGAFCGMRAALAEAGLDGFEGLSVAVQGAGHVGAALAGHLLDAGALVTVADIYADRVAPLLERGARACDPAEVHRQPVDVFAPCALGAAVSATTITELRCRVIAGAANNQLQSAELGDELHRRGIVYAPDYVINAGGVINIGEELGRRYDATRARASVERVEQNLRTVFETARREGIAPHRAADRVAEERITRAREEAASTPS